MGRLRFRFYKGAGLCLRWLELGGMDMQVIVCDADVDDSCLLVSFLTGRVRGVKIDTCSSNFIQ